MIDPRLLSVRAWCDATALALAATAPPPKLANADQWQAWALVVIQDPKVSVLVPPDPRGFPDWRSWAERFVQCVPL